MLGKFSFLLKGTIYLAKADQISILPGIKGVACENLC